MPVIALTQEMGSLAPEVAQLVAQQGKLALMRHEVLEGVAGKMQVPASLISRLREGKAGRRERRSVDIQEIAVYTAKEVFALADKGDVVLRGWGATCLLHPVQHVVTVRITRPFEKRVAWLMENLGIDDLPSAQAEVRRSDESHATRMHAVFGVTWGDPLLYDIVLNTDRISVESCAAQILELARRPEFKESKASRAQLADLALAAAVRGALKENEATREVNVDIHADKGKVVLRGLVLNKKELDETVRVTGTVAGVRKVDNQLRQMAVYRRFTQAKS